MKRHYELQPNVWHAKPLVFDWDDETGDVSGPDADWIRERANWGEVDAHPLPWAWTFSAEPLKNKTDMAAIVGFEHKLPADLAPFYPKLKNNPANAELLDDYGNVIGTIPLLN